MQWLDQMRRVGAQANFRAGDRLCTQGDRSDRLYMLLSGTVAVCLGTQRLDSVGPGALLGAEAALGKGVHALTCIAERECVVLAVDAAAAIHLSETYPEFTQYMASALAGLLCAAAGASAAAPSGETQQGPAARTARRAPPAAETPQPAAEASAPPLSAAEAKPGAAPGAPVLPAGHPAYGLAAPDSSRGFLCEKEYDCPICRKSFKDLSPLSFKLKTKEITADLRTIYEDFEILWHSVRVCPHCNAAGLTTSFPKLSTRDAKLLKVNGYAEAAAQFGGWTSPRTIDQVFEAYYLALRCLELSSKDVLIKAQIWRRLMWLYGDAADEPRRLDAAQKALAAYQEVFQTKTLSGTEEQNVNIILGDLYRLHNDRSNAYRHYMNVAHLGKAGNQTLYRHATDAIAELRAEQG